MKKFVRIFVVMMMILAMAVPAFAANEFVPSIDVKPSPGLVELYEDEEGSVYGIIIDENGKTILELRAGEIIVTPISEIDDADLPQDVKDLMHEVYEDLMDGTVTLEEVEGLLEKLQEELGDLASIDDLTIKDLFDVTVINEEAIDYLNQDGYYLKVIFDVAVDPDAFFEVLVYGENGWEMVHDYVINEDGTVTVYFQHISPVLFLTAGEDAVAGGEDMPPTGDTAGNVLAWGGACIGAMALLLVAMKSRKKEMN